MANGKVASQSYIVPVGAGGVLGHLGRMIIMVVTFGFVFPNAFIEGMDVREIDNQGGGKK